MIADGHYSIVVAVYDRCYFPENLKMAALTERRHKRFAKLSLIGVLVDDVHHDFFG
jgi:hypothetical protein